jgi:ribosomal protein L20
MGGPVAAKRIVESRRRRRTVGRNGTGARGVPGKKKRVTRKPKKQYIKLTPYQFKRLTDHIKKNNLRKVLIKEITH